MDILTLFKPDGIYSIDRLYSLLDAAGNPDNWNKVELQKKLDELIGYKLARQVDVEFDGKVVLTARDETDLPPAVPIDDCYVPTDNCRVVPVYWLMRD